MPEKAPQTKMLLGEIYIDCEFIPAEDGMEFHRVTDISFAVGKGIEKLYLNIFDAKIGRNSLGDIIANRFETIEKLIEKQEKEEADGRF
jgi:hypothetical protein